MGGAGDPGIVADLEVFERQTGHRIVERSETDGTYRYVVQRAR